MNLGPFIDLTSGKKLYFLHPKVDQIDINDIAQGLSSIGRFNGHCRPWYSVAEHSVRGSYIVTPGLELDFLLHDADEGLGLGDMISPLKRLLPQFREIQDRVAAVVAKRYGVTFPHPAAVKIADLTMLKREKKDLKRHSDWRDIPYPLLPDKIVPWTPEVAKRRFLARFYQLYKGAA